MSSPQGIEIGCGGIFPETITDGEQLQVAGTITNNRSENVTVTVDVFLEGPRYPDDHPYFPGQENRFRLESETTLVAAGGSESFTTEPDSVTLYSRPAGEYEVQIEASIT